MEGGVLWRMDVMHRSCAVALGIDLNIVGSDEHHSFNTFLPLSNDVIRKERQNQTLHAVLCGSTAVCSPICVMSVA